jgi:hypothetical protein
VVRYITILTIHSISCRMWIFLVVILMLVGCWYLMYCQRTDVAIIKNMITTQRTKLCLARVEISRGALWRPRRQPADSEQIRLGARDQDYLAHIDILEQLLMAYDSAADELLAVDYPPSLAGELLTQLHSTGEMVDGIFNSIYSGASIGCS